MKAYIRSSACISAQNTFGYQPFLKNLVECETTRLKTIEPDYKGYIDPKQIRRMSHVIKMGIATAKQCLATAHVTMPGAIITGTAFGCMEDTVTFLTRIIQQEEELLPPTPFIQSTHNTVAAQIALMLKCHSYNSTFVHKGISFEHALFDALMLLNEEEADNILVGGIDEMVDTSYKVLTRLGLYRRSPVSNLNLFKTEAKGTIGGEGSAFFLLTRHPAADSMAEITAVKMLCFPQNVEDSIKDFLTANDTAISDIDLVITGRNGDLNYDKVYDQLESSLFKASALANYKHLCGEYPTSAAFGVWLAANILEKGEVPPVTIQKAGGISKPRKILFYNHYQGKYHSLILLSAVN